MYAVLCPDSLTGSDALSRKPVSELQPDLRYHVIKTFGSGEAPVIFREWARLDGVCVLHTIFVNGTGEACDSHRDFPEAIAKSRSGQVNRLASPE